MKCHLMQKKSIKHSKEMQRRIQSLVQAVIADSLVNGVGHTIKKLKENTENLREKGDKEHENNN